MDIKIKSSDWQNQVLDHQSNWFQVRINATDFSSTLPLTGSLLSACIQQSSEILKDDKTTTVARYQLKDGSVVIKRYNPRNQWHKIKRALRRTRAKRCWHMSYHFAKAGLNVSRPIMMVEECFGPLRGNAFFVNECLDGEELLNALPNMSSEKRTIVKQSMLDAFSKMEQALVSHGDMKASNLIWKNGQLFFIDLDAAQVHKSKVSWRKANNKDRKRFLKNWRSQPELLSLFSEL